MCAETAAQSVVLEPCTAVAIFKEPVGVVVFGDEEKSFSKIILGRQVKGKRLKIVEVASTGDVDAKVKRQLVPWGLRCRVEILCVRSERKPP